MALDGVAGKTCLPQADPSRFRDPSNPPADFGRIRTSRVGFLGPSAHTTYSILGLRSCMVKNLCWRVNLPIRFTRPTRRSDSPPAPPRIHPKCCSDPEIQFGWPYRDGDAREHLQHFGHCAPLRALRALCRLRGATCLYFPGRALSQEVCHPLRYHRRPGSHLKASFPLRPYAGCP